MTLPRAVGAAAMAAALVAGTAGCTDQGGVGGIVGGPLPTDPGSLGGATTTSLTATTTTTVLPPTTGAPSTTGIPPGQPPPTGPATTGPPRGLRLGGSDLGVTQVGAPFREAVAAVAVELGRPTGDPARDSSCIGAENETTWGSFRLAGSGGRVSGWLSTSTTLATPAGATVGTTVAALRQAYGATLQVRPPAPDVATAFIVDSPALGGSVAGTLTGPGDADTVTSLFHGTCEAA